MKRILPAALVLVLAACGGSRSKPDVPPAPRTWKDMNTDQRKQYMEDVVMPRAKEVFTAFDARYADMDCKTCHGRGADDGSYEMPNPDLRPLPNTPEAFMALLEGDPDVQRFTPFMVEKVEPMMGELLQMTVFDPETETGDLSCSTCHTLVDEAGNRVPDPRGREGHDHHDHDHHDHAD